MQQILPIVVSMRTTSMKDDHFSPNDSWIQTQLQQARKILLLRERQPPSLPIYLLRLTPKQ